MAPNLHLAVPPAELSWRQGLAFHGVVRLPVLYFSNLKMGRISFMLIRPVEAGDATEWLRMRVALWPDDPEKEAAEIDAFLATWLRPVSKFQVAGFRWQVQIASDDILNVKPET